ncbi:hypothetical protein D3C85_1461440 [compost metagenome]
MLLPGFVRAWGIQQGQASLGLIHFTQLSKFHFDDRHLMNFVVAGEGEAHLKFAGESDQIIQVLEESENCVGASIGLLEEGLVRDQ